MPGEEAARLIRDGSDVLVVMVTAEASENDRVLGPRLGDDYLVKPFSPREVGGSDTWFLDGGGDGLGGRQDVVSGLVADFGERQEQALRVGLLDVPDGPRGAGARGVGTSLPVAATGAAATGAVVVLLHAARARAPIAAAAQLMVLIRVRRDFGPCLSSLAGLAFLM